MRKDLMMSTRILVAYATWAGSTTGVAETISQTLREAGADAAVRPVAAVDDLTGYDALVLGAAVHAGKPHPALRHFVERHATDLNTMPVAYFVVCATMMEDTPEHRETVLTYLTPLRAIKEPVSIGLFAGAYNPKTVNVLFRWLAKLMRAPEGDWRDWEAIRAWATDLAPLMMQPGPVATPMGAEAPSPL